MFKILKNILLYNFFFLLFFEIKVFAYFDPGTGSYIIQIILAFLGSIIVFLRNPITFIKEYLKKRKKQSKEK